MKISGQKLKVALVEDTSAVRDNLAELMSEAPDIEVCGIYSNGRSAIRGFKEQPPDVAIIDLGLPDVSGIEVIRSAATMTPKIEPIAYTVFDDEVSLFLALKAGAVGYLLKEASGEQILDAIRETLRGGAMISPTLARRLLKEFSSAPDEQPMPELTPREREVLEHLVQGANYLNVAARLGIGAETVRTHIKSIYRKLHVSNRADVVRTAIERKLIKPGGG